MKLICSMRLKFGMPLHPMYHTPSNQYTCLAMFDVKDCIYFLSTHREDRGAGGEPQVSLQHRGVLSRLLTCSGTQLLERSSILELTEVFKVLKLYLSLSSNKSNI